MLPEPQWTTPFLNDMFDIRPGKINKNEPILEIIDDDDFGASCTYTNVGRSPPIEDLDSDGVRAGPNESHGDSDSATYDPNDDDGAILSAAQPSPSGPTSSVDRQAKLKAAQSIAGKHNCFNQTRKRYYKKKNFTIVRIQFRFSWVRRYRSANSGCHSVWSC